MEVWTRKIYANTYVDKIHYQIKGNTIYFDVHEKKAVAMNAGISYTSHYGGSMNITFNVPIFLRNYTNHIGSRIEVSEYPKIDFYTTSIHRFEENSIYGQGKIFIHKDPLFQYQNGKNTSIYSTQKLGVSAMIGTELARQWIIEFEAGLMMSSYRYEKGKNPFRNLNKIIVCSEQNSVYKKIVPIERTSLRKVSMYKLEALQKTVSINIP
ncbi:hypothetical protein HMPREF9466_00772 [Fusobacterium necrophorum subsp. funduliforme 1_1_36S]|nr:hypothetical protein HMPREF9466_00772 [Fusobacterium necrophorum subsp. funduliforme 1_1_36S]